MSKNLTPFLEQIRNRILLSDLISKHTRVIHKGRNIKALCPFHKEKTPSFNIDDLKGLYHCFGCGASGDHFSFVMQTQNLNFMEACQYLAGQVGLELPKDPLQQPHTRIIELLERVCVWFQEQLQRSPGELAREYLATRSITQGSISTFRLGYAPLQGLPTFLKNQGFSEDEGIEAGVLISSDTGRIYERFKGRLMFPILSLKGQVIGFGGRVIQQGEPKYLNSPESALFQKRYTLYGLPQARQHLRSKAVIVEGYMDVIRLHQQELPIAVAPLGTALTVEQLQQLWRYVPCPYLAFDGDTAGEKAAYSAVERALPYIKANNSLKILFLPKGDDPDSLVKREGKERFEKLMETATPIANLLFQKVIRGYPIEKLSPEEFVSIKNHLKGYLKQIQDIDLRQAYAQQFNQNLNQVSQATAIKTISKPIRSKKISLEKILLVTLLNHTYLWKEVGEAFMNLVFTQPDEEKLRLTVIDHFLNNPNLATWPSSLDGLKEFTDQAFYISVPFAKIGYDQKITAKGWWETYDCLSRLSLKEDQRQYANLLKNQLTASNWERLKALKTTLT